MNAAKLIAWLVLPIVGLVLLGMVAVWAVGWLFDGGLFYLLAGALVAGGGAYLYHRTKRALAPGTRARLRLDAASETYRQRNG
jgi:hypothetical protein